MVSTLKWVITCESRKGPLWGLRLWYQFLYGITRIVTKFESFLAARPMESLLGFDVCVWVCIAIAMLFMVENFSNWFKYYISRKWEVKLSDYDGACYWWWEIWLCYLECVYKILKDDILEFSKKAHINNSSPHASRLFDYRVPPSI